MTTLEKRSQHLDDSLSLSCVIETSHFVKDHVEYTLRVQRGAASENSWHVTKRYNDFSVLDTSLRQSNIQLSLPPKKVFGNMERDFILERQKGLQDYLTELMKYPLLSSSIAAKKFFDPSNYAEPLQEVALQQISMYFRSEPGWEVVEPLPEVGWRLRKQYFLTKSADHQSKSRTIMYWTTYGPCLYIPSKELGSFMKVLPSLDHPYIYPITMATANAEGVMVMRSFHDDGTLKDYICRVKPKGSYLKKYGVQKLYNTLPLHDIKTFGRQILEGLKFLYDQNIPYGHLHTGNIIVKDGQCKLLDIENSVLGLPSVHRQRYCNLKRLEGMCRIDVYNLGHVLYEMFTGQTLNSDTMDALPDSCPSQLSSVLESILTENGLKTGLPSISDLLVNPLFKDVYLQEKKVSLKLSSKVKECLKVVCEETEKRLKNDQRLLNQVRRRSKAQSVHAKEEKKLSRKLKGTSVSSAPVTADCPVSPSD